MPSSSIIAGHDVAMGPGAAGKPVKVTLRTKGIIVFVALFVYIVIVVVAIAQQWHKSLVLAAQLNQLNDREQKVELLQVALGHALLEVEAKSLSTNPAEASKDVLLDIELIRRNAEKLTRVYPNLVPIHERLGRNLTGLLAAPGRENFIVLRQNMEAMGRQLGQISKQVHEAREQAVNASNRLQNMIAATGVAAGLLGVVLLGATIGFFLTRLARDIRKLEARGSEVVEGYRGPLLDVTRHDEVGRLMESVNRMQSELRQREQQLEIARQQRFHHEKMAAIGSFAAEIAHEINNPIAAITGIAQSISNAKQTCHCPDAEMPGCHPELILEHSKRIAAITRHIAELAAPQSAEPALLDLNVLVRNTCDFISYDPRFRGIDLVLELDHDLPAVNAIADQVTQVLMNLLINAADALESVIGRKPFIRVVTGVAGCEVSLAVSDNGCGMDRAVLSQAFNDCFTTKPFGKGSGLGLFLCKTLIEGCGGRIELESTPDAGTTVQLHLPLPHRQRVAT